RCHQSNPRHPLPHPALRVETALHAISRQNAPLLLNIFRCIGTWLPRKWNCCRKEEPRRYRAMDPSNSDYVRKASQSSWPQSPSLTITSLFRAKSSQRYETISVIGTAGHHDMDLHSHNAWLGLRAGCPQIPSDREEPGPRRLKWLLLQHCRWRK